MEEKINIAEILKDKPKGTKLYADAFGELSIEEICTEDDHGVEFGDKGYLFGDSCAWVKDIVPINLVPAILEKNGWRTQNRWYYYLDVAEGFISYIGIDFKHKSNKGHLYVEVDGNNMIEIQYCHELHHLLFGLGLNSEMEV